MKAATLLLSLMVAASHAAPQQYNAQAQYSTPIPIISQSQDGPNLDGSYQHSYATGNGIQAQETGFVKNFGSPDQELQSAQGSFSYTAPDGTVIQTVYTSDENGFLAQGAHLPTPPPIPPEILKALEFIASQPQQDYDDRGFPINKGR